MSKKRLNALVTDDELNELFHLALHAGIDADAISKALLVYKDFAWSIGQEGYTLGRKQYEKISEEVRNLSSGLNELRWDFASGLHTNMDDDDDHTHPSLLDEKVCHEMSRTVGFWMGEDSFDYVEPTGILNLVQPEEDELSAEQSFFNQFRSGVQSLNHACQHGYQGIPADVIELHKDAIARELQCGNWNAIETVLKEIDE